MCHAFNEKWVMTNNGSNRTVKPEKNQNAWREGKLWILGNIGSRHHQTSRDKIKNNKRIPQMNEKTYRNQARQQTSHQRDKHLGSRPCKILRTILKMKKGRIQTNRPKDKKVDDYAQGLTSKRWQTAVYLKRGGLSNIEDCVDTSIQGFVD